MKQRTKLGSEAGKHFILIIGALVVILPFYLMLSFSFKSPAEIQSISGGFFGAQEMMTDRKCLKTDRSEEECTMLPIVYNYTAAFKEAPLLRYLFNGVIVTLSIFVIQIIIALPCAYALAKLNFWGKDVVFGLVIFCLLIPVHAIALPLYLMLAKFGLTNTFASLVIPWTISVFGIFLMRQSFKSVPIELHEAAQVEGCGIFGILWKVYVPLARPTYIAYALVSVSTHWNNFLWPLIVTNSPDTRPLTVGLSIFAAPENGVDISIISAATIMSVAPLLVAFLLFQRHFVQAFLRAGIK